MSAAVQSDHDRQLDAILLIARATGLSIDDLVQWLDGVDAQRIADNVQKPPALSWDWSVTRRAFRAACVAVDVDAPGSHYLIRQIRHKGDRDEIAALVHHDHQHAPKIIKGMAQ